MADFKNIILNAFKKYSRHRTFVYLYNNDNAICVPQCMEYDYSVSEYPNGVVLFKSHYQMLGDKFFSTLTEYIKPIK